MQRPIFKTVLRTRELRLHSNTYAKRHTSAKLVVISLVREESSCRLTGTMMSGDQCNELGGIDSYFRYFFKKIEFNCYCRLKRKPSVPCSGLFLRQYNEPVSPLLSASNLFVYGGGKS